MSATYVSRGYGARVFQDASCTVAAGTTIAVLPVTMLGIVTQMYDPLLLSPGGIAAINAINPQMIRYLGSTGDYYNWSNNTNCVGAPGNAFIPLNPGSQVNSGYYVNPLTAFGVAPGGRIASLTGNYGIDPTGAHGGDSVLMANWLANAYYGNVGFATAGSYGATYAAPDGGHNFGSQVYMSIGNEQWDVGVETNNWASQTAAAYVANVSGASPGNFISLLRAVDTGGKLKIGIDLKADQASGGVSAWNQTLISGLHGLIDYVKVHVGVGPDTDYNILHAADNLAAMCKQIQYELNLYAGADASRIKIFFDAMNIQLTNPFTIQTTNIQSAMFAVDVFFGLMGAGAANMSWIFLHEFVSNLAGAYYGPMTVGDLGLNSFGGSGEPPTDTAMPAYWGLWLIGKACQPGDSMVQCTSTGQMVRSYAVLRASDGKLALIHINRGLQANGSVVQVQGHALAGTATQYIFDASCVYNAQVTQARQTTLSGLSSPFTLPLTPYSITLTILN